MNFIPYQLPESHENQLYKLRTSGITPIIAHPERYKFVQDDINIILRWLELGCFIMVDAGSLLNHFGKNCFLTAQIIIKNRWCHILGSDSHNDGKKKLLFKRSILFS